VDEHDSYPALQARTGRFTLGRPRGFTVSADGRRVVFLRSRASTDKATCLWVYDVRAATERLVADATALLREADTAADDLPRSERLRRERTRELAGGIVGYSTDAATTTAAFALAGRVYAADLVGGSGVRRLAVTEPAFDPRLDPTGRRIAYVHAGTLRVVELTGGTDRQLVAEDGVSFGLAEFVAAEEMGRQRGFWWAPDGGSLLAARVDERMVRRWHIADPARPDRQPVVVAYPCAGTANADVSLCVVELDGTRREVAWDRAGFPYLVAVRWPPRHRPLLLVASRDQRTMRVLEVEPAADETASTQPTIKRLREDTDEHWLEVVPGVPDRFGDGRLVHTVDDQDTRRLLVGDALVSPAGLQVHGAIAVTDEAVVFSGSTDPIERHVWIWRAATGQCTPLTSKSGIHGAAAAADVLVVTSTTLSDDEARTDVLRDGRPAGHIRNLGERAPFMPNVSISARGERQLRTALVLPSRHVAGSARLPVLMDPYGGPHAQRVVASRFGYLTSQWLADQGFAVVVVDGRGTPGRGPAWERSIAGDLATPVLQDQVDALHALAAHHADLDLTRVAIRGWSFGGYLAALAVLRRPDVFHAAVAGAPVTDWSLYDTYYTERYLGTDPNAPGYRASSLIADAPDLRRPLLLIHGLADDNVVAAHTLRLSAALVAAGRYHEVLPLPGVTHLAGNAEIAANLLRLEVAFLRRSLGIAAPR
jgi:dipeptidyl-peptidase-4